MKKAAAIVLAIGAAGFLGLQVWKWYGGSRKGAVRTEFGASSPEQDAQDKAYFTPWPVPTDFVALDKDNVKGMLSVIEAEFTDKSAAAGLTPRQQAALGPTASGMLDRIVHGRDMESTLQELSALGLVVTDQARELLLPYFDKGRSMTFMPKVSPGSVVVRKVYENGEELPEPFLGAMTTVQSPEWPGMLPMGNDPVVGKYLVVEARVSVWTPIVPEGRPELQLWGLHLAWDSARERWLPKGIVKYTKLERNTPKQVAITPM